MPGHVLVDPEALLAAAAELDAAALHLASSLTSVSVALRPPPAGSDEVSALAARYFWSTAQSLDASTSAAVSELHETAAALRVQAAAYREVDSSFSTALSAGVA
ncbi:PE domain-containing protein [Rhodococcus sp. BP-349]|uniref:PE domain-containing protein n=1 Tax=unclassified Rhodococcus (in: high G+C Gram-positive bacteria) TaxID=192944 RepID=UPI001C9A7210|nr:MULTISPECIES: PE domain-containing protein [unclassified Rhodococcus (in: high G+C Gram-positive bacteria)]MBY6539095.1 PE domain-containing protein [Rhodococcus sp. BP-363]MBY6544577.1 PE domain-containing protein [Rhodococcus sp. BP-369]MBY6563807.1 PE domain-containing protein [Rhodococcus sp. BP-370]MBY6578099.1 PE domain-containing protein [Rhodococcus sp. BP-364]MBY6587400.1 PE domain-containing protein [Rhodococcus sp. BP-358]